MELNYTEILTTIITLVIVPGMIWLGKCLADYLLEKSKNEKLDKYIKLASDCIADAVGDVAQTFVDHIEDKDWNEETKNEAFELAKVTALENLGLSGRKLIEEALGDFDGWVKTKIQAEVKRLEVK